MVRIGHLHLVVYDTMYTYIYDLYHVYIYRFCSTCTISVATPHEDFNIVVSPTGKQLSSGSSCDTPDASSIFACLKAEYHMMRRERNRILLQWQQEKKVSSIVQHRSKLIEKQRDAELVTSQEQTQVLKEAVGTNTLMYISILVHR